MPRRLAMLAALDVLPQLAHADDELQKKLANPVADIVTLPFQYNTTLHVGPLEKPQQTLNIQPVYPTTLNDEWKWINRAIIPVTSNPAMAANGERETGLGDITWQSFFSPKSEGLIWGFGPAMLLDTASKDALGTGKWSAGPTALALVESRQWTAGALVTQLWSFAGDDKRSDVNLLQLQPIISYRLNPAVSVGYIGIITANWEEKRSSQRWTVPVGGSVSGLTKPHGFVPVNYVLGAGYNAIRPDSAGDWFFRFQVNFILPK
ncbi:hypothetical protein IGB42_03528 [Andreprevotia sp. IGB-42]|nr:hypothetical protein IGB42_03528 [Andreprevotia sp. IGB-42]